MPFVSKIGEFMLGIGCDLLHLKIQFNPHINTDKMGKGDKKTRRGKLFQGSYGIKRRRNKPKPAAIIPQPKPAVQVEAVIKPAETKKAKAAPAAKKETKAKKTEESA